MKTSFIFILFLSLLLPATGLTDEAENRLLTSIAQHKEILEENAEDTVKYRKKLAALEKKIAASQKALAAAKSASGAAASQLAASRTSENERNKKLSDDLAMLAERKVATSLKRKEWMLAKLASLKTDSEKSKKAIARDRSRIAGLRKVTANKAIAAAPAPKPPVKKAPVVRKPVVTKAPVVRKPVVIKTPSVAKNTTKSVVGQKAPQTLTRSKNRPSLNPDAPTAIAGKTITRQVRPEPVLQKTPKPRVAKVALARSASVTQPENGASSLLSDMKQEERSLIRRRVNKLNEYIAEASAQENSKKAKRVRGSSNRGQKLKFAHMGGNIYKAEEPMTSGKHRITVDRSVFELNVPKKNDNALYTFYFDTRNVKKRRLIRFESRLIE